MRSFAAVLLLPWVSSQDVFLSKVKVGGCASSDACWPSADALRDLGNSLQGEVVLPGDKSWDNARHLKNKLLNIQPGAIVMAETVSDVQAAMKFAKTSSLDVSVKSNGNCYNGNCMKANSFHIDLHRMNAMSVDKSSMELRTEPGTNYEDIYKLCDANDVLVVGGMCKTVGMVGYSLGGGHGPLVRSLGLGADNIVSVDVVNADGDLIHASDSENKDLLWAHRGGGGGAFGIVVKLVARVHPPPPQMVSLSCAWPIKHHKFSAESLIADWGMIQQALPNEWQFYSTAMKIPLGPKAPGWIPIVMDGLFVLEGLHNGAWSQDMVDSVSGVLELGKEEQLRCEFQNHSTFLAWHSQAWFADEGPIDFRVAMASSFAQPNYDAAGHAKLIVDTVTKLAPTAFNMMFGVSLGGKVSNPDHDTSVSADFRNAVFFQENDADWNFGFSDRSELNWAHTVGEAMASLDGMSGSYLNEADPFKIRGDYEELFWGKETFTKLQTLKRKWDKQGLFDAAQSVHNVEI